MLGTLELIANVISKVVPGKSKEQAKEIADSIASADSKIHHKIMTERKALLEYEGRAKIMPLCIQIIRGLVRPLVTCAVVTVFLRAVILKEIPVERLWTVTLAVITFWFVGHQIEKIIKKAL